ncbi:MAG: MBL fold metallo-hydrolase [bacterium]|nr:MBL fold metallo-hydrolase [bacterium]
MHHFDVKKLIPIILLGIILSIFPGVLAAQTQNLEIHYINVQQGQCTLIIGPNGKTILYDGGYENKGATEIAPYLQSLGIQTSQALDYIVLSHRHTDHYVALTELINYGYDAATIYDNGSDTTNTYFQAYETAAASTTAGGLTTMALGATIDLGNGCTATCVASNGSVVGYGAVTGGTDNENDRSLCLLVKYGDFDYLVTGDLGGGPDLISCTGRSTSQVNIETPLSQALMPGGAYPLLSSYGVEVAHVAHHGSESSTNKDYMNLLTPAVACISVGEGQSANWYHPRVDVVNNVLLAQASCITASPALVLQTEEGSPTGVKTSFSGYSVGDIVITTDGIATYTISASGAVSQGPDERIAAGLPITLNFDENGGVDNPPVIYSVREENVGETSADIEWSTNENATSTVKYGTSSGSYGTTLNDSSMVATHSISLTGLTNTTTYYYVVESIDSINQTTTSSEYTFATGSSTGGSSDVVFSEIFYDTPGTDSIEEWIELYNNSSSSVDIGGWTITDNNNTGSSFTIPTGNTIAAGSYFTIAANSGGFNALYSYDADLYGSIPTLNNSGDALILKDGSSTVLDTVAWEGGASSGTPSGWGSSSAPSVSTGNTIVRTNPATDTDSYTDWSSASSNGEPQTQAMFLTVVVSEVFYDTPGTDSDEEWIELYNKTTSAVDIGGWTITDNNGTGSTYTIPVGSTIGPESYFTIAADSTGFNALYGYDADLYGSIPALNNTGDALLLKDNYDRLLDTVAWEGGASAGVPTDWGSSSAPSASTGSSIERSDVSVDTHTYADWASASGNGDPQTQNGGSGVVFSEIFYDTPGTDSKEEWIELYNNSASSVDIGGWVITDNNGTGSSYSIPSSTTIAAGGYLTIGINTSGFYNLYGYNPTITGSIPALNNTGDALLLKNGDGDVVDTVAYEGGASSGVPSGWGSGPSAPTGSSIVRTSVTVDTDTDADWSVVSGNGNPQIN